MLPKLFDWPIFFFFLRILLIIYIFFQKFKFNPTINIPQNSFPISVPHLFSIECSNAIGNPFSMRDPNYPVMLRDENQEVSRDSQEIPNEILITNIKDRPKFYCSRSMIEQTNCRNYDVMDCSVTFTVDRNIFVLGVQVPSQIPVVNLCDSVSMKN